MSFDLVRADKGLFAVYQTMYSNADIEMWYDWDRRLSDTDWTDDCFFVMLDGQKAGGLIITGDCYMYAFLVSPFCDRLAFWSFICKAEPRREARGMLDADMRVLEMLGYKIHHSSQVMCRPADRFDYEAPEGFSFRALDIERDGAELGEALVASYKGGICDEINGAATPEAALEDMRGVWDFYAARRFSTLLIDDSTGKVAAFCVAGIGKKYVHNYGEIAELCVLPQYRGRGFAKLLIKKALTEACETSPYVKLFVYSGNNAEYLYRRLGFIAGPQFTNMVKR